MTDKVDYTLIDSDIVDLVRALNENGIITVSSCSGHGKEYGHIWLKDGRVLIILNPNYSKGDDAVKSEVSAILEKGRR